MQYIRTCNETRSTLAIICQNLCKYLVHTPNHRNRSNSLSLWWKHTIILLNVCEKQYLQWVSQCSEYGHPRTTWVVQHVELPIGKTNTPLRKIIPLAPIKEIGTLVLPVGHFRWPSMKGRSEADGYCQQWRWKTCKSNRSFVIESLKYSYVAPIFCVCICVEVYSVSSRMLCVLVCMRWL